MGCSKSSAEGKSPSDAAVGPRGLGAHEEAPDQARSKTEVKSSNSEKQMNETQFVQSRTMAFGFVDEMDNVPEVEKPQILKALSDRSWSTRWKLASSAKTRASKVSEASSILAGMAGLGKAVEELDTHGSNMTNLQLSSGFVSGRITRGIKISILAFEVANTIVKGVNLMHSLSKENIKHLKEVVLPSEAVQILISRDIDELLGIAAADKREELEVFSREVVRFGNRCLDPCWHSLNRYFEKLASKFSPQNHLKEVTETVMKQLMTSVQYTVELHHELRTCDSIEQDYKRNQDEDSTNVTQKVENLHILRQNLRILRKNVKCLKRRSLWTKNFEEVVGKLVDIIHSLHLKMHYNLGNTESEDTCIVNLVEVNMRCHKRLGPAGLALHYANIISQIDTLASQPCSIPPKTRDILYQRLPPAVKNAVRSRIQSFQVNEEVTVSKIKEEMDKILRWLVPMANNTIKAYHGFGWFGEWVNTWTELNRKPIVLFRIETLYHAEKEKTDVYILDLVMWLHLLISYSRPAADGGIKLPIKSPVHSSAQKSMTVTLLANKLRSPSSILTKEEEEMLHKVNFRKLTPGISKSQEFLTEKSRKGSLGG